MLLCASAQLDIQVDDATVVYHGGANYTAARAFCDTYRIPNGRACAYDVVRTSGATPGQLVELAWGTLPDAYKDARDADAVVQELARRVATLQSFSLDDLSVPVVQPHWRLAFSGGSGADIAAILKGWGALYRDALFHAMVEPRVHVKPRVGFVSSWFCNSAIGRLYAGLIEKLDKAKFEVYVFHVREPSGRLKRDFFTDAIDASSRAKVLPRDLDAARHEIAAAALDIVVFTDIGMETFTYALAFARMAPIQCVFWGHPTTSGVPSESVDYYLVMDTAEGLSGSERYSEQLVRLDTLGAYYYSNESGQYDSTKSREMYAAESAYLPSSGHLYAAPQHCLKFHPLFDEALVRLLTRDADAILVVKDCSTTITLQERLAKRVDIKGRIVKVPQLSLQDYVRLFGGSHVALETFPFGGSITSLDSFEGGTPVVSLAQLSGRPALTVALYDIMGVSGCVASSINEYVETAVRIASNATLRASIRARLDAARSSLYESMAAVREIEAFFIRALKLS